MRKLVLLGMPGGGKSAVGRQLAKLLSSDFVDIDAVVEARAGMSIPEFFLHAGEAAFRDLEEEYTKELLTKNVANEAGVVIATGGGVILRDSSRNLIGSLSSAVYLHATPVQLLRRVMHDRNRPLLQSADKLSVLKSAYEIRDPLYREVAHYVIDTGESSAKSVAALIANCMAGVDGQKS